MPDFTLNQLRIYRVLRGGALIRDDISILLDIPRTTVYDALSRLQEKGFIDKFSKNNGVGRPYTYWEVVRG